jgi:GAF domain-containing protein
MTQDAPTDGFRVRRGRENELAETFVVLADTLVDDFDVVDLLDRLVAACVSLLGVTAAGLLLDDQKGNLAVVASSSEETRLLEVYQLQSDEGPCLDCVRTGNAVTSADLGLDIERWPLFVPAALAAGFRSVTAVPLRLREARIGGLHLFSRLPGQLGEDDQRLAQALADVATIGILQQRSAHRSSMIAEQLQHALNSRVVIEQAKGVLAERHGVDMNAAFASLRRHARNHNHKLTQTALAVVTGELDPGSITPG